MSSKHLQVNSPLTRTEQSTFLFRGSERHHACIPWYSASPFDQGSQFGTCLSDLSRSLHDKKNSGEISMTVTPERIREIFKSLENSDAASFFEHVADNVDWTVMGTHTSRPRTPSPHSSLSSIRFAGTGSRGPKGIRSSSSHYAGQMEGKSTGEKAALESSVVHLEQVIRRTALNHPQEAFGAQLQALLILSRRIETLVSSLAREI
jgi:hypothetical protein